MFDLYENITNEVIESLQKGVIPWRRPWATFLDGLSYNRITRQPYSLLNQLLLSANPGEYATFKGWQVVGGRVRKGEKAKKIYFWKIYQREETDANGQKIKKNIPVLRYYSVFHISQVDNVMPLEKESYHTQPIQEAEEIFNGYITRENIRLTVGPSNQAYYSPSSDEIVLPELSQFKDAGEYYSTAFHEATHSTMKAGRCNREAENKDAFFGSCDYSKEELTAELGSCFICSKLGISTTGTMENSEGYIQSWIQALNGDKRLIVSAAGRAEKAAKYIYGDAAADDAG